MTTPKIRCLTALLHLCWALQIGACTPGISKTSAEQKGIQGGLLPHTPIDLGGGWSLSNPPMPTLTRHLGCYNEHRIIQRLTITLQYQKKDYPVQSVFPITIHRSLWVNRYFVGTDKAGKIPPEACEDIHMDEPEALWVTTKRIADTLNTFMESGVTVETLPREVVQRASIIFRMLQTQSHSSIKQAAEQFPSAYILKTYPGTKADHMGELTCSATEIDPIPPYGTAIITAASCVDDIDFELGTGQFGSGRLIQPNLVITHRQAANATPHIALVLAENESGSAAPTAQISLPESTLGTTRLQMVSMGNNHEGFPVVWFPNYDFTTEEALILTSGQKITPEQIGSGYLLEKDSQETLIGVVTNAKPIKNKAWAELFQIAIAPIQNAKDFFLCARREAERYRTSPDLLRVTCPSAQGMEGDQEFKIGGLQVLVTGVESIHCRVENNRTRIVGQRTIIVTDSDTSLPFRYEWIAQNPIDNGIPGREFHLDSPQLNYPPNHEPKNPSSWFAGRPMETRTLIPQCPSYMPPCKEHGVATSDIRYLNCNCHHNDEVESVDHLIKKIQFDLGEASRPSDHTWNDVKNAILVNR